MKVMSEMNQSRMNGGFWERSGRLKYWFSHPFYLLYQYNGPVIILRQEAAVGINAGEAQGNSRSATGTANGGPRPRPCLRRSHCGLHCGLGSVTGSQPDSLKLGAP